MSVSYFQPAFSYQNRTIEFHSYRPVSLLRALPLSFLRIPPNRLPRSILCTIPRFRLGILLGFLLDLITRSLLRLAFVLRAGI